MGAAQMFEFVKRLSPFTGTLAAEATLGVDLIAHYLRGRETPPGD
jgi:hypothetical protein